MSSGPVAERPSFWAGYRQSLKSPDVEETVDLYVHRPLAYVMARALLNTPVSPNFITLCSLVAGLFGAYLIVLDVPHNFQWAALCCFACTVLDQSFDVRQYHILRFDYRIGPTV